MEENNRPGYRATETVEVSSADERIKSLRQAYLEGRLKVDSERVADKIIAFEKTLDRIFPAEP